MRKLAFPAETGASQDLQEGLDENPIRQPAGRH